MNRIRDRVPWLCVLFVAFAVCMYAPNYILAGEARAGRVVGAVEDPTPIGGHVDSMWDPWIDVACDYLGWLPKIEDYCPKKIKVLRTPWGPEPNASRAGGKRVGTEAGVIVDDGVPF